MVKKLLKLIPPHHTYVEVFGGGASLLFAKEPSPVEVYNDLDSDLVNFFRTLRDPEKFKQFHRKVFLTPWSREEYNFCRDTWESCEDEIERVYRWYVVARMSFSGGFGGSWGFAVTGSYRSMAGTSSDWLSIIEMLPEIHARLMRVQIEHDDFRQILKTYDTLNTFFYLDPPYVSSTRSGGKYKHEMNDKDHEELVNILLNLQGKVMLSGYNHPIYNPLEQAGWNRIGYKTACHAVGRTRGTGIQGEGIAMKKQARTESIWLNPQTMASRKSSLSLF